MGKQKYPYITDKKLYAAVMYACQLVRKYNTFNVACNAAAKKYCVSVKNVRAEVSKRAAAGKQGKRIGKQKWFVCVNLHEAEGVNHWFSDLRVERGKNKQTKEKTIYWPRFELDATVSVRVLKEFDTKKEAELWLDDFRKRNND